MVILHRFGVVVSGPSRPHCFTVVAKHLFSPCSDASASVSPCIRRLLFCCIIEVACAAHPTADCIWMTASLTLWFLWLTVALFFPFAASSASAIGGFRLSRVIGGFPGQSLSDPSIIGHHGRS
ncbi:hypothetical protein HN51_021154 [Arachis hypogaea]